MWLEYTIPPHQLPQMQLCTHNKQHWYIFNTLHQPPTILPINIWIANGWIHPPWQCNLDKIASYAYHIQDKRSSNNMSRQLPQSACAYTASAASIIVLAAVAVPSGVQSIAHFAGTKLSFVSPLTSKLKHPNQIARPCICNWQSKCKDIMHEWKNLALIRPIICCLNNEWNWY